MNPLLALLEQVAAGDLAPDAALAQWRAGQEADLGFAKADLKRAQRCGIPEVVYAAGKTPDQVRDIFHALHHDGAPVLATRADADHAQAVQSLYPAAVYHPTARMLLLPDLPETTGHGHIAVVCAGTSDLPVAEEAALTARFLGGHVTRITDVGVAGLHRLIHRLDDIRAARVVIAIAGMEGALPSVLGGLIDRPIIAVPTSVGYGLHLQGLTPLLAMLNSCAPGITVVNVDNGFGAAVAATLINRLE